MAQWIRCLLYKHENLRLDFQSTREMPGVLAHIYNPSTWEADRGESLVLSAASLPNSKLRILWEMLSQTVRLKVIVENTDFNL